MTANDTVSGDLTLVMPSGQNVTVFPGTPGDVQCQNLTESYQCAVLGQSLGDTIVWFALMPMRGGASSGSSCRQSSTWRTATPTS